MLQASKEKHGEAKVWTNQVLVFERGRQPDKTVPNFNNLDKGKEGTRVTYDSLSQF